MDSAFFEELYRRYYAPALLYARTLCHSSAMAEDMVQEAFYRAWLALPENVVSFRGWLFRVLCNLIIDQQRQRKHLTDDAPPDTADDATPESILLQREDAAALYRAMAALDADERELLTLYFFARLTAPELGELLHATPVAIRQRLRRARIRLRQRMEEDGYEF